MYLMAKLGYTWYPKDWGNSEAVFELTLIERGLYRELIDMAMLNDNKTVINIKVWGRKFGSSNDEIEQILITLTDLKLIEVDKESLFIPSCEPRLKLVRGGSIGGKKSKPTSKSKENLKEAFPKASTEAFPKPKEIEKKGKEIETPSFDYVVIENKFREWCKKKDLDLVKVLEQFDAAWEYYEGLLWINKNGKPVKDPYATIRNVWMKKTSELQKPKEHKELKASDFWGDESR